MGEVLGNAVDQVVPFVVIGWRGDVGAFPVDGLIPACQGFRHEIEHHKGLHTDFQQVVIDFIAVLEAVNGLSTFGKAVNAHVILQKTVESYVLKSAGIVNHFQVFPVVGP